MNRIGALVQRVGAAGTLAPAILAAYLFVHGCGGGKTGFVLGAHAWGVSFVAAWCSA